MLSSFVVTAWGYLREIAEIVVLGFIVAGVINAIVNKDMVARYLGGSLPGANALGALIGIVTPLCCCSAIPTAMTLYRSGSRRGPACAFLIATPWFNWYGLTALVVILGPRAALAVAGSAVLIAFATGVAIDIVDLISPGSTTAPVAVAAVPEPSTRSLQNTEAAAAGQLGAPDNLRVTGKPSAPGSRRGTQGPNGDAACCASCGDECWRGHERLFDVSDPLGKLRAGIRFALDELRELGPWMLAGVLLGAAIETFVPERVFTHYLGGTSLLGLLAALVVAGIFSADSLGSLPWVQSLLSKGLGVGSAMTLLVAGVGTNVSTLGPVARVMGRRTAILYAASVVVLAGVFGFGLNLLR